MNRTITRQLAKLPSGYRKTASLEIHIPASHETAGRGKLVEVARFQSSTQGQVDAFFKRTDTLVQEINEVEYDGLVMQSIGRALPDSNDGHIIRGALYSAKQLAEDARFPVVLGQIVEAQKAVERVLG